MLSNLKKKIKNFAGADNLEFLTHTRNYLSAELIRNLILALSFPLFTQLLTPAEYGILSIFSSIVTILTIVFMLNMRSGIARYYLEKHSDFSSALGSNVVFLIVLNLFFLSLAVWFRRPLASFCAVDETVFLFASVVSSFTVFVETYLSYLNASKQSARYSGISVLKTVLLLAGSITLILLLRENKYFGKIYADLAVVVLLFGYSFYQLNKLARYSFDIKYITYTLRFSVPLIPHAVSRFILGYFDRIIIKQLTTDTATGLYSFAYDVGMSMNLIVMATVKAWRPIFFDEYREANFERIERMVYDYANTIYLAAIGIILFATDAVTLLAEARYLPSLKLVPVIVVGYVFVFLYTLFFQYAAYRKRTELISLSTFIAGAANIVLNYQFIPIYGYEAAAYTTLVSFALLFFLHYANARFVLKERVISLRTVGPNLLVVGAVAALQLYLTTTISSYALFFMLRVGIMACVGGYFLWCKNRSNRLQLPPLQK